jgi:hypothetical protein
MQLLREGWNWKIGTYQKVIFHGFAKPSWIKGIGGITKLLAGYRGSWRKLKGGNAIRCQLFIVVLAIFGGPLLF